jgi:hypothetical protein
MPTAWLHGPPKRSYSAYIALRIPAKPALGALLVPLFGQFQKGNSRKFVMESNGKYRPFGRFA